MVCSDTGVRIGDGKGACLHLRAVHDALLRAGHDVRLVGVAASDADRVAAWGTTCRTVPHPGRSSGAERERRKLATVEAVHERCLDLVQDWVPELVYERSSLFGTAGARIAEVTGAAHVLELNALLAVEERRWRGLQHADLAVAREAQVLAAADLLVAVSDELATEVRALTGRPAQDVLVLPNGVDEQLFARLPARAAARAALGLPGEAFLVAFTGSLRPWHGLDVAVRALPLLPDDVRLVVAGDGPVRAEVEQLAAELGVTGRVDWLGQLPHEQVPTVLAGCDVAVAPYPPLVDFAFSPLKVYEYLAAGLPVVASDLGQLREMLTGPDGAGQLVPPGEPVALAAAITRLHDDPTHALRARAAAPEQLARHGWNGRITRLLAALPDSPAVAGWPAGHPALLDPSLHPWAGAFEGLLPGARVEQVLRHLPGRRVTSRVRVPDPAAPGGSRPAVLKLFASPRARGNARRLTALSAAAVGGAGAQLPAVLATDPAGHLIALEWQPGSVLAPMTGDRLLAGLQSAGAALRTLHELPAVLDREWTWVEEVSMLRRKVAAVPRDEAPLRTRLSATCDRVISSTAGLFGAARVPAHRDCHPQQVVVDDDGVACWIDLDDASMAPAALDLGNFLAHLDRDALIGRRTAEETAQARSAFLTGYRGSASGARQGGPECDETAGDETAGWELLSLTRLVAIALARHHDREQAVALLDEVDRRMHAGVARGSRHPRAVAL